MALKNLLTGQQWRNRHRKQTYGHGERGGESEMYAKNNMETYITKHYILIKKICLQCRTPSFNPWVGKIPQRRKWQPLQHSFLESSMDRGAWRATVHGIFPGKDTGAGGHFPPQGIFLTQRLNPDLLHCRQILYDLSYEPYSKFPLVIYFIYGNVSFHDTLSIHFRLSSPLPMSISLFSMSVSPLLPCK